MPDTEIEDAVSPEDEDKPELGHEPDDIPADPGPQPEPEEEPTHDGPEGDPPE